VGGATPTAYRREKCLRKEDLRGRKEEDVIDTQREGLRSAVHPVPVKGFPARG